MKYIIMLLTLCSCSLSFEVNQKEQEDQNDKTINYCVKNCSPYKVLAFSRSHALCYCSMEKIK